MLRERFKTFAFENYYKTLRPNIEYGRIHRENLEFSTNAKNSSNTFTIKK